MQYSTTIMLNMCVVSTARSRGQTKNTLERGDVLGALGLGGGSATMQSRARSATGTPPRKSTGGRNPPLFQ